MNDRKYTKGDCYALCEIIENLLVHHPRILGKVACYLGYEYKHTKHILLRLANDINDIICEEQQENDYTEQMAEIMELKHIKGE